MRHTHAHTHTHIKIYSLQSEKDQLIGGYAISISGNFDDYSDKIHIRLHTTTLWRAYKVIWYTYKLISELKIMTMSLFALKSRLVLSTPHTHTHIKIYSLQSEKDQLIGGYAISISGNFDDYSDKIHIRLHTTTLWRAYKVIWYTYKLISELKIMTMSLFALKSRLVLSTQCAYTVYYIYIKHTSARYRFFPFSRHLSL